MARTQHIIDESLAGQRMDRVVSALHPGISRAAAGALFAQERVQINGRPCKPAARAVPGVRLSVDLLPPAPSSAEPEDIPLRIVYEDETMVVIDKEAGMVVHPAPGNQHGTLVNALLGRYATLPGDPMRPGIVHRLDKDTSGLIVVARTAEAVATLAGAFKRREVHKEYLALLHGSMRPQEGSIEAPIGRDPRYRQRMAIVAVGGRAAHTTYRTEEVFAGYSLIRAFPETGRMHQLRVHFSAAGHPIANDPIYGRNSGNAHGRRLFLHAARLRIAHPATGQEHTFEAPLPPDLQELLELLRRT